MQEYLDRVALLYDDDGYREKTPTGARRGDAGPMGRQVAGKEFLDAFLAHGRWTDLVAVTHDEAGATSLLNHWVALPTHLTDGRSLRVVPLRRFHREFFPAAPAPLLHFPGPINPAYAWARQHGGPSFCLSGVTHTICTWRVVDWFDQMVTAPFEPFDALVCISRQAQTVIRGLTDSYAEHLRQRFGGEPRLRARLEHIPLGVNPEKYSPATPEERRAARAGLGAADDEVVVLFVGRLSYHAKVHPFPIYAGLDRAARQTGRKVHLVLAGWAVNRRIEEDFRDGARAFAPHVRTTFVDGTLPEWRYSVWHAADVFTSLTDNVQETLSQVVLEAMACGLPVVATNWDGCKDQVADGETGFLVPAYTMRDATRDLTSRLVLGEVRYDDFLAECNQTVAVDVGAAAGAFARLLGDPGLRRQMGESGRRRVLDQFTWQQAVHAYERLWAEQEKDRQAFVGKSDPRSGPPGPACYPALDHSFASYPTALLGESTVLRASAEAAGRLAELLGNPLTNYAPGGRCASAALLAAALAKAETAIPLAELDALFADAGESPTAARATVGWMLKYGLLSVTTP